MQINMEERENKKKKKNKPEPNRMELQCTHRLGRLALPG
jgi:hypothetical protein